jgi:hypothetical protein
MQKQLLIVATRTHSLMMDPHLKAISEVDLVTNHELAVPNPITHVSQFFSKSNKDNINHSLLSKTRSKYTSNLSNMAGSVIYNVMNKK